MRAIGKLDEAKPCLPARYRQPNAG